MFIEDGVCLLDETQQGGKNRKPFVECRSPFNMN